MIMSRQHQNMALALFGLFALVLLIIAAAPYVWLHHLRQSETIAFRNLEAAQQRVSTLSGVASIDPSDDEATIANAYLVPGGTNGIAAANLQSRLNAIAGQHNALIDVSRVFPPQREGEFTRVKVGVSLRTNLAGLQATLYTLEAERPFVLVDRVLINRTARRTDRLRNDTAADQRPLNLELTLSGFAKFYEANRQ